MGRASSAKKVSKASRAAGRQRSSRNLVWPVAMVAVVALGVALVVVSRPDRAEAVAPRIGQDHWHGAYGVYVCDEYLAPFADQNGDAVGIHTHEDGLIHIHPTSTEASGEDATLEDFTDEIGLTVEDDRLELPGDDGETYEGGDDCGGEPGQVQLVVWDGPEDEEGEVLDADLVGHRLRDGEVLAIAFVPEGADIPQPPVAARLSDPTAAEEGRPVAPVEGVPEPSTTTTAPPADGETTTTAPGASSTTASTAPPTTAAPTTTAAP